MSKFTACESGHIILHPSLLPASAMDRCSALPSQIILATEDVHDSTSPRRLAQSIGSLRWLCAIEATTIDLSRTLVPAGSLGESRSALLSMRPPNVH